MKTPIKPPGRLLSALEINRTAKWLLSQQKSTGEIPWMAGGKMDPWDHIHAAMGLTTMGYHTAAKAAFRYLANTQQPNGSWPAERVNGQITNATQESNHAAYLATGLWHLHYAQPNPDFLAENDLDDAFAPTGYKVYYQQDYSHIHSKMIGAVCTWLSSSWSIKDLAPG